MRSAFFYVCFAVFGFVGLISIKFPQALFSLIILVPIALMGLKDAFQKKQTIRRNFPILGRFRYLLEMIRPEIQQYFIEHDTAGTPIPRTLRSLVYQRAKRQIETVPFGTQENVYSSNYEWINHTMKPTIVDESGLRVLVGGDECTQKYSCSLLNISAMSYGSLSKNAIEALNGGAKIGDFYHNTGEGSISPYHLNRGGDLVWQIGTGYFGCRDEDGNFDLEKFKVNANRPEVKMIEIKISQGAKPGHGGILPKEKVTKEISEIRHVPMGVDVISPGGHSAFNSPRELLEFIKKLREASGGKPVGFKLCMGYPEEFVSVCKAMVTTQIFPDFITVDGSEGGTGASPLEFTNSVGTPLEDGLVFVHNTLRGFGIRQKLKIIASGKVLTAFNMLNRLALGADIINSARGFMLAIGCIQALRCHENVCPTGVATTNPKFYEGLDVNLKEVRTANFHAKTLHTFKELLQIVGVERPSQLRRHHIQRRIRGVGATNLEEIYPYLGEGTLLEEPYPISYQKIMDKVDIDHFADVHW